MKLKNIIWIITAVVGVYFLSSRTKTMAITAKSQLDPERRMQALR